MVEGSDIIHSLSGTFTSVFTCGIFLSNVADIIIMPDIRELDWRRIRCVLYDAGKGLIA